MSDPSSSFSSRFGYRAADVEITIREDAPPAIRDGVLMLGYKFGLSADSMRDTVCQVLLVRPDQNNWSTEPIEREVGHLIDSAPWYKIYDIAERIYVNIFNWTTQQEYQIELDQLFRENGVGWQMENGQIVARGSEAFALATRGATGMMRDAGAPTAAKEVHEALTDISRRPDADVTGAIQHAMAALECVAREVDGSKDTLGAIINRLQLPAPLDSALHKLWGFTSERGRHIQEGREPRFEEAEFVVTVASAVSVYLLRHKARSSML